jgi:hypothetical protein
MLSVPPACYTADAASITVMTKSWSGSRDLHAERCPLGVLTALAVPDTTFGAATVLLDESSCVCSACFVFVPPSSVKHCTMHGSLDTTMARLFSGTASCSSAAAQNRPVFQLSVCQLGLEALLDCKRLASSTAGCCFLRRCTDACSMLLSMLHLPWSCIECKLARHVAAC